ncbi:sugar phosphate isomerase/epimerase [Shouchella sp. 1P09AA]|uniref:sugar phosphate isomerase/epimerase family protein n=1 Tax=unclassified Shouchella TaxID=2893065 RepID=UPI0039A3AEB3
MKLCFNQATTLENSTLEKDLIYCEKHGYDFIEIRTEDKLPEYIHEHGFDSLASFFENSHLKPLALNALVFFNNLTPSAHGAMLAQFSNMLKQADALKIPYIVAVPLVTTEPITKMEIEKSSVAVLRQLAKMAAPYEIKIALEFVGHPDCTINTFGDAYNIVTKVDCENVGLVFDCFHFHAMGSSYEDLQKADGEKIFIIHIDDTEDYPIGALRDHHRVWPGEGCINLKKQFQLLREIGAIEKPVSVELFRPEYYKMDPEETIKQAKESTKRVMQQMLEGSV